MAHLNNTMSTSLLTIHKKNAHLTKEERVMIEAGKKLLVQNKNRMMNFLNNSSSGFYVHRKSFLI